MIRDIFQKMSSWTQLFFLFSFSFTGLLIGSLLMMQMSPSGDILQASATEMRKMQAVYAIFTFLFPSLLCASLFYKQPEDHLKISQRPNPLFLLLSLALVFTIQPIISSIGLWNAQLSLPESMASIEAKLKQMTADNHEIMKKLLLDETSLSWLWNLLVVAVLAAIVEEFFFRGVLQQIIIKVASNVHVGIWITAFIFSVIHFEFYGFVPRLLLGALLGYLFVWSRSLWIPIIVHFLNNAIIVVLYPYLHNNEYYKMIGTQSTWWLSVLSVILTATILFYMIRQYRKEESMLTL